MTIHERLNEAAFRASRSFCYPCYQEAPSGRCSRCHSDDLMRLLPGVGCEWGTDWIIAALVAENVPMFDATRAFEEWVAEAYPETVAVAWIRVDAAWAVQQLDPVSWRLEEGAWTDSEVAEGRLITFDHGATFFATADIETYLDETELLAKVTPI